MIHPISPPSSRRRFRWIAALGICVAIAGLAGYWGYTLFLPYREISEWQAAPSRQLRLDFSDLSRSGFPIDPHLSIAAPSLGRTHAAIPWQWHSADLRLAIRPGLSHHLQFSTMGPQQLLLWPMGKDRTDSTSPGLYMFTAGESEGEILIDWDTQWRHLDLILHDLIAGPRATPDMTVARSELALTRSRVTAAMRFQLESTDIMVKGASAFPLGPRMAVLRLRGQIEGDVPPAPLTAAMAQWRDQGGIIEIGAFYLEWGDLKINAAGTAVLDAALQPLAALTADISGWQDLILTLVQQGTLSAEHGALARTVLSLIAKTPEGGGPSVLSLPLTIQNNRLFLGPVSLGRVPAIDWQTLGPNGRR